MNIGYEYFFLGGGGQKGKEILNISKKKKKKQKQKKNTNRNVQNNTYSWKLDFRSLTCKSLWNFCIHQILFHPHIEELLIGIALASICLFICLSHFFLVTIYYFLKKATTCDICVTQTM